jgi:hypothetical protein
VAKGWIVRGLSRQRPSRAVRWQWFRCDLPDEIDPRAFAGCGVVIHAAYATRARSEAEARRVNEDGTARVLKLTNDAGARLVFISSLSAHEGARSYYGRSKLAIERSARSCARPGHSARLGSGGAGWRRLRRDGGSGPIAEAHPAGWRRHTATPDDPHRRSRCGGGFCGGARSCRQAPARRALAITSSPILEPCGGTA